MTKFLDADINFYPDRITYVGDPTEGTEITSGDVELVLMHEWESSIMKKHADFVCELGGNILEVGFGMGISANFIQENGVSSHTIIELHPQIAEKAREWAADKPNVTILEGAWEEIIPTLQEGTIQITPKKFDGIFYDTYGFWCPDGQFANIIKPHTKNTTRITHWNPLHNVGSTCGFMNKPDYKIDFDEISIDVDKQPSGYYLGETYYFPKVFLNV